MPLFWRKNRKQNMANRFAGLFRSLRSSSQTPKKTPGETTAGKQSTAPATSLEPSTIDALDSTSPQFGQPRVVDVAFAPSRNRSPPHNASLAPPVFTIDELDGEEGVANHDIHYIVDNDRVAGGKDDTTASESTKSVAMAAKGEHRRSNIGRVPSVSKLRAENKPKLPHAKLEASDRTTQPDGVNFYVSLDKATEKFLGMEGDTLISVVENTKSNEKNVRAVMSSVEMKLRRTNSERLRPEGSGVSTVTRITRRSTIASGSRKSMPLLFSTSDQPPDSDIKLLESQEIVPETQISGSSGTNGSASNDCDHVILQSENSPRNTPIIKKCPDTNESQHSVSRSKNAKFHKLFKSVPQDEYPIDSYLCAFKGDILLQGMMYVSENWICFHSKIKARGRLLEIPLARVISITREKLALVIPNAIGIQIADQKYVFGSFISRDSTYKLLTTLWKHSQNSSDSANTKENDLSCFNDFTSAHRVLCNGTGDDITGSADISCESDTTYENCNVGDDVIVEQIYSASSYARLAEAQTSDLSADAENGRVAGLFSVRCIDYRKIVTALSTLAVRIQRIPRTNMLLAICSILVLFLLLSAMGLTYKIVLIQTQLEMSHLWTHARQQSFRERAMGDMYTLQSETHMATIHQLHNILKANIHVLEQVHKSLQSLQWYKTSTSPTQECPPPDKRQNTP